MHWYASINIFESVSILVKSNCRILKFQKAWLSWLLSNLHGHSTTIWAKFYPILTPHPTRVYFKFYQFFNTSPSMVVWFGRQISNQPTGQTPQLFGLEIQICYTHFLQKLSNPVLFAHCCCHSKIINTHESHFCFKSQFKYFKSLE